MGAENNFITQKYKYVVVLTNTSNQKVLNPDKISRQLSNDEKGKSVQPNGGSEGGGHGHPDRGGGGGEGEGEQAGGD